MATFFSIYSLFLFFSNSNAFYSDLLYIFFFLSNYYISRTFNIIVIDANKIYLCYTRGNLRRSKCRLLCSVFFFKCLYMCINVKWLKLWYYNINVTYGYVYIFMYKQAICMHLVKQMTRVCLYALFFVYVFFSTSNA